MKTPAIHKREAAFKRNPDIWNTKLGAGEIDFYKPRQETLAQWVGEVEKRMGALRLRPAWGRACTPHKLTSSSLFPFPVAVLVKAA